MTSVQAFEQTEPLIEEDYRALSALAVTSFVLGGLSVLAFLGPIFAVICVLGIICGISATMKIRSRRMELTGEGLATAGIALSTFCLIGSMGLFTYVFLTEVPDGHARMYYAELQPTKGVRGEKTPPLAASIDGEKVFIKGYVYPGERQRGIQTFLLVRDQGDCCFGGDPVVTERIQVTLADPERLTYTKRLVKVWGTFRLEEMASAADATKGGVYYHIDEAGWSQ